MDKFRQPQPMEGFSRPGSLGGEAHDDDSVEGHMMDDERIQEGSGSSGFKATDDDTEGHYVGKRASDEEDTEGHVTLKRASDEDDTEGHVTLKRASDEDDVEGHIAGLNRRASDDDDNTEGTGTNFR